MTDIFTPVDIETQEIDNPYEALVGDGKKFKTNDDLAKAKLESDRFIKQLLSEQAELRQEVSQKATIEEIMTQIKNMSQPSQVQSPHERPQESGTGADTPDLENLVSQLFEKRTAAEKLNANKTAVHNKLTETWGADAQINLNKKANELGVSLEYLARISQESPSAFYRLVGLDAQPKNIAAVPTAVRSTVNTPINSGSGERTKAHYDNLKRVNPTEYFSAKIQNQMYKDAMKLGEAFYDA